jgi:branched-chain amino acid aminotransferase
MIHRYVSHNGKVMPVEQARLSPGQEGLINGWGLFTTLRVFEGRPFAFERHMKRLRRDAARTHVPFPFADEEMRAQVDELIRKNEVKEGALRVYVVWNRTGIWHSDEEFAPVDLILTVGPLPSFREPVRLDLREHGRHAASPLAGVKTISWLNNVWNAYEAKHRGFDEVVLLNERGEVAECTAANVFAVRGGAVVTPPLSSGCLAGITREVLMEIGPKAGVAVTEAVLRPDDLYGADEVFITSTNRALLSVGEIAGHKIHLAPGPIAGKLFEAFRGYMAEYFAGAKKNPEGRQASA